MISGILAMLKKPVQLPARLHGTWITIFGWTDEDYEVGSDLVASIRLTMVSLHEHGHTEDQIADIVLEEFAHVFEDVSVELDMSSETGACGLRMDLVPHDFG